MNRRQKIIVSVTGIFLVLLLLVGLTYAYFLTQITGNTNTKSISVSTANLALVYEDGNGTLSSANAIMPGTKINFLDAKGNAVSKKEFTVTNKGNATIDSYAVILENLSIFYSNDTDKVDVGDATNLTHPDDLRITITCTSSVLGKECDSRDNIVFPTTNDILLTNSIDAGETQSYELTMEYLETGTDQSADMNKSIIGKINIIDTNNTVDISGTVDNTNENAYVEIVEVNETTGTNTSELNNSKVSYLDKTGNYKIVGLLPGQYTIKVYDKSNDDTSIVLKTEKTFKIQKGLDVGVLGDVITIDDFSRTLIINVEAFDGNYILNISEDINMSHLNILSIEDAQSEGVLLKNTIVIDESNNNVYVPSNFKVTEDASNVGDGVVIEDIDGNQFVWVPVEFDEGTDNKTFDDIFQRTKLYNGTKNMTNYESFHEPASSSGIEIYVDAERTTTTLLSETNDLTGEYAEYKAMRASVKKYGGFYIGRYETGSKTKKSQCSQGTTEMVIKQGAYPYVYTAWGPSMSQTTGNIIEYSTVSTCGGSAASPVELNRGKGAVELARSFYSNSGSVVSTLPYAVQYDTILTWLYSIENPFQTIASGSQAKFVNNSAGMGWYYDNVENNPNHLTGINIENELCLVGVCNRTKNIYDLAGNLEEWTMEAMNKYSRTHRGGNYTDNGLPEATSGKIDPDSDHEERPAKYRSNNYPNVPVQTYGFRVALYLK